jgi:hypothetical protein
MTVINSARFAGVASPRLPSVSEDYDPTDFERYSNVLRLYFNQINNVVNQVGAGILAAPAVNGVVQAPSVFTVSKLPSALDVGIGVRSFVSDATATTFASVAVGGGANPVPVYSDGVDWRIG